MPHYQIFHTVPIVGDQRTQLAEAITNLHCTTFSAPSIFVNITYHYYKQGEDYEKTTFIGGREVQTNYIVGHLRPRGGDNRPKLNEITNRLTSIWNNTMSPANAGWLSDPKALHNVFLMEDIAAGAEQGFVLPMAGEDAKWAETNLEGFKERAEAGDESMKALVGEFERGFGEGRS